MALSTPTQPLDAAGDIFYVGIPLSINATRKFKAPAKIVVDFFLSRLT